MDHFVMIIYNQVRFSSSLYNRVQINEDDETMVDGGVKGSRGGGRRRRKRRKPTAGEASEVEEGGGGWRGVERGCRGRGGVGGGGVSPEHD